MSTAVADKLTAKEHEALRAVLEILRKPGPMGFETLQQNVLGHLIRSRSDKDTDGLNYLVSAITEYFTNIGNRDILGLLAGGPEAVLLDEQSHLSALAGITSLLKRDTWLGSWMAVLAERSKDRNMTPLDVARTLVSQIEEFECDVDITKRTLALYPKLFDSSGSEQAQG